MQKDHSEKPKLRIRNTTPEPIRRNIVENTITNVRAASSHHRSTMMPCDFAIPQNFAKKKLALDRMSIFSTQSLLDVTKMTVPECDDTEMKLLYDQYLQNMMLEVILKKKAKEKAELFLCQLATITKEYEHNEDKLFKLKTRERDIINLIKIQNDIDSQIIDVNNYTNLLRCSDIILPETPEEWKETSKTLKLCSENLKSIIDLIGTKNETYQDINIHIKEFVNIINNIENHQERVEKMLCSLQALVLKTASLCLMQCHD
ncbi:uncharacterized protein LOC102677942 isoform X2 [Apis dorsata]|uniref:uncharacterized protein LOC102677942 isoform X2 n=1 Tax=Apis dorsata TaxID=7462 RepID=UPI0003DF69E8|nr:uncharacterized protein LOC102677942 isoform X2 [Apis dorsata]